MKKYFVLLAVAAMSIACGSNNAAKQESIEEKANRLCGATIEAILEGDQEKFKELNVEFINWTKELSPEDKALVEQIAKTHAQKLM